MSQLIEIYPDLVYFIVGVAQFFFVFLKAFQQRNVAWASFPWIPPTSYAIAGFEVMVIWNIAQSGLGWNQYWILVFAMGTGGLSGALLATYLHKRFISNGH